MTADIAFLHFAVWSLLFLNVITLWLVGSTIRHLGRVQDFMFREVLGEPEAQKR
jgi:membrane associated rhomboid family serine protease